MSGMWLYIIYICKYVIVIRIKVDRRFHLLPATPYQNARISVFFLLRGATQILISVAMIRSVYYSLCSVRYVCLWLRAIDGDAVFAPLFTVHKPEIRSTANKNIYVFAICHAHAIT